MLETLKSGLYEDFFRDFYEAAVPFLNPEVYGRSPLENSSFIASSLNPNENLHGRGFVARLSGSTAEFLSIWRRMFFGEKPFALDEEGSLTAHFEPAIPSYLIGEERQISATFLGQTRVTYLLPDGRDLIPGTYHVQNIEILYADGRTEQVRALRGQTAEDLRNGSITTLTVTLER